MRTLIEIYEEAQIVGWTKELRLEYETTQALTRYFGGR